MSTNLIGQILLEQFRVESFVASGGMGAVYRVWDIKRNAPLAMKVLHSELAEDPSAFKSFQREAHALQRLAHPNIVAFYGVYQTLDFTFLLERFIDGPSLKNILRRQQGRPLPLNEVLIYLKALTSALGYAHAGGVVHCDVKPGNVMLDQGGNIFLTDFGIARHSDSATTTLAGAGAPAYMAPEQIRGKAVTPATDVYALGILLFEMLTGQRPFRGNEVGTEKGGTTSNERIRYAHLHLPPPDPHHLNPSLSQELADVMLKALEKNPASRYRSTQEFFVALCLAAGATSAKVPDRVILQSTPPSQPQSPPQPAFFRETAVRHVVASPPQISPLLWVGGVSFIIVLIMIMAGGLGGSGRANLLPSTQAAIESPISPLVPLAVFTATSISLPLSIPTSTVSSPAPYISPILASSPTSYIPPTAVPILPTATAFIPTVNSSIPSAPTGKIVFTCQVFKDSTRDQICIMNADGSNWRRLTQDDHADNTYPSLSPDGQSVVYSSNRSGNPEIYETDLSGRTTQLTQGFSDVDGPAISPDGRFIVFNNNSATYSEIWIMSRDGSNPHVLYGAQADAKDPTWSPDGSRVLFAVGGINDKHLYSININGSKLQLISNDFTTPGGSAWSPNGNLISAYAPGGWNSEIYIMNADGSNLHHLSTGGTALSPSFSPDGQWIAFTGYIDHPQEANGCEIYIMRVDGSDIRRLTNNDYCNWQPRWGP